MFTPTILTTTEGEEDKKKVELKMYKDQIEDADYTKDFLPLIMNSIHYNSTRCRDKLLKMLMLCDEFEVTQLTIDIEDM